MSGEICSQFNDGSLNHTQVGFNKLNKNEDDNSNCRQPPKNKGSFGQYLHHNQ